MELNIVQGAAIRLPWGSHHFQMMHGSQIFNNPYVSQYIPGELEHCSFLPQHSVGDDDNHNVAFWGFGFFFIVLELGPYAFSCFGISKTTAIKRGTNSVVFSIMIYDHLLVKLFLRFSSICSSEFKPMKQFENRSLQSRAIMWLVKLIWSIRDTYDNNNHKHCSFNIVLI